MQVTPHKTWFCCRWGPRSWGRFGADRADGSVARWGTRRRADARSRRRHRARHSARASARLLPHQTAAQRQEAAVSVQTYRRRGVRKTDRWRGDVRRQQTCVNKCSHPNCTQTLQHFGQQKGTNAQSRARDFSCEAFKKKLVTFACKKTTLYGLQLLVELQYDSLSANRMRNQLNDPLQIEIQTITAVGKKPTSCAHRNSLCLAPTDNWRLISCTWLVYIRTRAYFVIFLRHIAVQNSTHFWMCSLVWITRPRRTALCHASE